MPWFDVAVNVGLDDLRHLEAADQYDVGDVVGAVCEQFVDRQQALRVRAFGGAVATIAAQSESLVHRQEVGPFVPENGGILLFDELLLPHHDVLDMDHPLESLSKHSPHSDPRNHSQIPSQIPIEVQNG